METAGFIIGVIALLVGLMAVPTILQMLFGRPRLAFEADEFTGSEGKILVLAIKNEPVKSKLLLGLGVEREPGDLLGFFDIQEIGTGKILARSVSGLLQCAPMRTVGLLARSLPGFTVGMTVISTRNGIAQIVNARAEEDAPPILIPSGHYIAHIAVVRGQHTYQIKQELRVGDQDHLTIWESRKVVSTTQ